MGKDRRAATEDDPRYAAKRSMKKIATLESITAERSFMKMTVCYRVIGTPTVTRSTRRRGVTIILTVTMKMMSSPFITIHIGHQREDCFLQHRKVIGDHRSILSVCADRAVKTIFLTSELLFRYISCNTR